MRAAELQNNQDITDKTVYLAPNARLHYSRNLIGRVYARTSASMELKGAGSCTLLFCPVIHNKNQVFARRQSLSLDRPSGPVVTERTLRRGDEGDDVRAMQEALVKKGFSVSTDGSYGETTERAVRDFQRQNGLNVDGEIGAQTREKLKV